MKVLYIGSGKSAISCNDPIYSDYIKVGANNAWRLFSENNRLDYWLHSGDFPSENRPKSPVYHDEISYTQYSKSCELAATTLSWKTSSPQHMAGYTIFFQGLYWIMLVLKPDKIGLLGFDHDYNPTKVDKWLSEGKPNIQNQFNKKTEKSIAEWSENFFKNYETDFFYGHGTPDPLRLGKDYLLTKMELAKTSAATLGIDIVNLSSVRDGINSFRTD